MDDGDSGTEDGWMPLQSNTGNARTTYNHIRLNPGESYNYRIFPEHKGAYGNPADVSGSTKAATVPDPVPGLRAMPDGPTRIKLDWDMPSFNGGSTITDYLVQVHSDNDNNNAFADDTAPSPLWDDAANGMTDAATRTYTFKGLGAGDARWFRVFAITEPTSPTFLTLMTWQAPVGFVATRLTPERPVCRKA